MPLISNRINLALKDSRCNYLPILLIVKTLISTIIRKTISLQDDHILTPVLPPIPIHYRSIDLVQAPASVITFYLLTQTP
jgi:hypothetical protein